MRGRRALAGTVVCIALAGLLVLLAAGRTWSHGEVRLPGSATALHLRVAGRDVAPSLPPLAWALIALAAGAVGARGWLRRVVGLVIVIMAASVVGVAVTARGDVAHALEARERGAQGIPVQATANGWWGLVLLAGVAAAVAGALIVLRGPTWSSLGARYDAPARAAGLQGDPDRDAWAALDRGEDPTA